MATASAPTVAIIGAGLTGLLAAHGLRKNGFNVALYEREASLDVRRRDWTILIHWGLPILAKLLPEDVLANLPEAICNPHVNFTPEIETMPFINSRTGEPVINSPTPGARRVTRQKFRRVLAQGIDIIWGKSLQAMVPGDEGVTLTFEDGETMRADYVLGADGASSRVREILLGPEAGKPVLSGLMFATGIMAYGDVSKVEAVVKLHPVTMGFMGGGTSGGTGVMDVGGQPDDMSKWTTFWVKIWPGPTPSLQGQEAIDYVKEHSKDLCEPFKSIIEWTPEGSTCYIDQMKVWVPVPFQNHGGRVTLAGDAAHPMLPFRGQGLQNAIQDACNYVEALSKLRDSPGAEMRQQVMAEYDAEMVARGAKAVNQSLHEGSLAFDDKTISQMIMARKGHGQVD